ncbi:MAG TPA: GlsB/YeaQ/YmgE family stress response membrane protein [Bryobacteraceae bacterium]|nr:GlsB/YeaQ/YmgE family stress response membrane protein [Bryobacteraceae bacterium]
MSLLYFLFVGLIAGWLAGKIMRGSGYGIIGDMVIGIIGALIGGHVLGWLGFVTYSLIGNIVSALVGAIILIFLVRLIKRV